MANSADPEPAAEGRRARRQRETRAALLAAAIALLQERGIYGMRVEDITQRADVGKGVFYNHFASKEALVAELVTQGVELLEGSYLARVTPGGPLGARIEALAQAQQAFLEDHPEFAVVLHQGRGLLLLGDRGAASLRAAFAAYLERLARRIPAPDEADAWSDEDLLDAATAIAGAGAGYRSFCIAVGLPIRVTTIGAALVDGVPALLEARRRSAARDPLARA